MRELLNGLKRYQNQSNNTTPVANDTASPFSEDSSYQNNAAMELINSVTGVDEEGRSRQKILTYAARRYASAIEKNPGDYDALYNWALVLQESADNVDPDSASPSKDALLEEACRKYEEATHLCPTLHDATLHYEKAVKLNWNTPRHLITGDLHCRNLVQLYLQRRNTTLLRQLLFRGAIQLQFDFHRAIYNLGTVLYGLAEDLLRIGEAVSRKDISPNDLYSQCAVYIAAAHALKPNYSVYRSALRLVRSMLPLPYLKVGYLTAPPPSNPIPPHNDWKRTQFVLNHEGLYQLVSEQKTSRPSLSGRTSDATNNQNKAVRVDIFDIVSVSACADLTLPPGAGLSINTIHGPLYLVADSWESLDCWLDAIRLVYTIFARGKSDVLAGVITG